MKQITKLYNMKKTQISKKTLKMIEDSAKNLKKEKASKPIKLPEK